MSRSRQSFGRGLRGFGRASAAALIVAALLSIAPTRPVAALTCLTGSYCATLTVDPTGAGSGSFTTTDGAGIDCAFPNPDASKCTATYTWSHVLGPTITATWVAKADPGTYVCTSAMTQDCSLLGGTYAGTTQLQSGVESLVSPVYYQPLLHIYMGTPGDGTGLLSLDGGAQCDPDTCAFKALYGQHTLVATPTNGSTFAGWMGLCYGQGETCTFLLSENGTLMDVFFDLQPSSAPTTAPTPAATSRPTTAPTSHPTSAPTASTTTRPTSGAAPTPTGASTAAAPPPAGESGAPASGASGSFAAPGIGGVGPSASPEVGAVAATSATSDSSILFVVAIVVGLGLAGVAIAVGLAVGLRRSNR